MSFGVSVFSSLLVSLCRLTVSKALLMSSDTRMVREGGWGSLKPLIMVLVMLCSAVVVEC